MTEPEKPSPPRVSRRGWRTRIAWGLLVGAVLLVVLYRPIVIGVLHSAGIRMAARQNVKLSFEIEGGILSGLKLKDVKAVPVGDSPVDLISIESLQVHYNLVRLFRYGFRDFVTGYHLRNATLIISPSRGTETQKQELAKVLRDILQQPALFSDHVQVENFSLTIHTPDGPFVLGEAHALLDPVTPGFIKARELTIPRFGSWHNVHTAATYIDRHLIMRDFSLGSDLRAVRLELDGSQRDKGISYLSFEGTVLGGDVGLFLWRREIDSNTTDGQFTASISNLPLKTVHDFFHWEPAVSGTVTHVSIQLAGNPDIPSQWEGNCSLQAENARIGGAGIEHAAANLLVTGGVARMDRAELSTGGNRLLIRMDRKLPDSATELFNSGLKATLVLDAPALSKLYSGFSSGMVHGEGECRICNKEFTATLDSTMSGLECTGEETHLAIQTGTAHLQFGYDIRQRISGTPWFDGFHATLATDVKLLSLGPYGVDSGAVVAHLQEGKLGIDSAGFHRGPNTINFDGQYKLPDSSNSSPGWADAVFDLRFNIDAPSLAALNIGKPRSPLTALNGSMIGSGEIHRAAGETSGHGTLEARDLVFQQFSARHLAVNIPVAHNSARGITFQLDINGKDQINGEGSLDLRAPFAYEGRLSGSLHDLSVFQPLVKSPLAGSLDIDWHGSGQLQLLHHSGEGRIALRNGRIADFTRVDGEVAGIYSPESIELGTFHIRSDQGSVQAGIKLHDERLHVDELRLQIGTIATLNGALSIPMDLRTPTQPETVFPSTGALDGQLTLEAVDLNKLFPPAKPNVQPAPVGSRTSRNRSRPKAAVLPPTTDLNVRGHVEGSIAVRGTLGSPELNAIVHGRDLLAMAAKNLPPCASTISLAFLKNRLTVNGVIAQPGISPLQFTGAIPLSLKQVIEDRRIEPSTPISVAVHLPSSPAALLAHVVPEVRYAEGQISINASAVGTLANPIFAGGVTLNLTAIRLQNSDVPGIGNFRGDLRFSGNQLTLQQFQGDVAGGPFAVTGRVNLEHVTDPQLDLRFRSQGTLLVRNDSLTLRADSDLKIAGPVSTAQVTGKIGITKSRFFREVEILPIGLPGRPAPKHAPWQGGFSIDAPPFRGWNFDIAVKTVEPLVVRGNLANGFAYADLHLGGNGLAPAMEGTARIENFVASLPFSRLTVDYGYLYFGQGAPFNPTLDIHGTSRIRDYNINVYIYGTASEPQTLFTSEPALAQEEVIALLATGATSQELKENNQMLAGRAGVLLLQNLYHKIFKPHAPPASAKPDQPLDRFSLDVGTVDPRTGRQEINGRFKLTNQYEIDAGVDVQGDVQLQLRYLLRFR